MKLEFLMNQENCTGYDDFQKRHVKKLTAIQEQFNQHPHYQDSLGWMDVEQWAHSAQLKELSELALQIQSQADVFIVVGVGGSNQAARAVIEALKKYDDTCEIVYAGHHLSAHYYHQLIEKYKDKSIYINVIAKNFATLEPGIGFRILSDFLNQKYGSSAHERIYMTGTVGSRLHQLCQEQQYTFLTFPDDIGGRFSC